MTKSTSSKSRSFLGFTVAAALALIAVGIYSRGNAVVEQPDERTRSGFVPAVKERQPVNPNHGYRLDGASWGDELDYDAFAPEPGQDDADLGPFPELQGMDIAILKSSR